MIPESIRSNTDLFVKVRFVKKHVFPKNTKKLSKGLILFVFIISWADQHKNALLIAKEVLDTSAKLTIVYSDPDPNFMIDFPCNLIKRSNDLFWEDKFKSCIDVAGDDGVLIIHSDCYCDDWRYLVNRCRNITLKYKNIGVWAPRIEGTFFDLSVSKIYKIDNSKLAHSALTDGIIFYLSPYVINRMRQVNYGNNKFGWGIDALFCSTSHVNNKLVVIDDAVKVLHPQEITGYDRNLANLGMREFLKQFSHRERVEYELLRTYVVHNRARVAARKRKSF